MRFLDAEQTRLALPMADCIAAMRVALSDERETPLRTQLGGSLFMPGGIPGASGIKVVSTTPGHPAGIVVVFDENGVPVGAVDGPTLTSIRTGAGCGLATALLASPEAVTLAMLGGGAMAADQVAAVRTVRDITRVVVWSRTAATAARLAERIDAETTDDVHTAVEAADVVSCATPATMPLFDAAAVRPGTHVNAIGAFTPTMAELPPSLLHDAFVVVDDSAAAAAEAGDLLQAGVAPDAEVADLLAGRIEPPTGVTTVFKSVGIASQDVAAAVTALDNAQALDLGTVVS